MPRSQWAFLFSILTLNLVVGPSISNSLAQESPQSFIASAEAELESLTAHAERAAFLNGVDETAEHTNLSAEASRIVRDRAVTLAREAATHKAGATGGAIRRKLALMQLAITLPAPRDSDLSKELAELVSHLETNYTTALNCTKLDNCRPRNDLYRVMRESRDSEELLAAWEEWRAHARNIRTQYAKMVDIVNNGAKELGYSDTGDLWRSHYEMPSDRFAAEYDRLWNQVRPLYKALHCHVRAKLRDAYPGEVTEGRPIPAHLLGNMWAQHWTGIDDIVGIGGAENQLDITELLKSKGFTPIDMIRAGESFFVSLGFPNLPGTFWDKSMIVKPEGKKVNCQASAWDIDAKDGDVRLKMCTEVNEQDFLTVHHELGHIYYYLAYKDQSHLFRAGANPGFHEAIGDVLARSITPSYLVDIGLLDKEPAAGSDLRFLFRTALDMIPRLAMSIVVDKWRWGVFSGDIPPESYNSAWWALRERYQGVKQPILRTEDDFDAGMFYHISNNVPYDRYFIAQILQFDIHRGLCEAANKSGPLHQCSIFQSKAAGARLQKALSTGGSMPWPETLQGLTGRQEIDASSIIDYFAPVTEWLETQNRGRPCGWD